MKLLWSEVLHSQTLRCRGKLGGLNVEEEADLGNIYPGKVINLFLLGKKNGWRSRYLWRDLDC